MKRKGFGRVVFFGEGSGPDCFFWRVYLRESEREFLFLRESFCFERDCFCLKEMVCLFLREIVSLNLFFSKNVFYGFFFEVFFSSFS